MSQYERRAEAAMVKYTNAELVLAVLGGERTAFAELVRRYERAAWVTAWKILRDYHAAQDATQNAFVHAYTRLSQLRKPDHFGIWLLRITQREALRIARQRGGAHSVDVTGEIAAGENSKGLASVEVLLAVGRLPEHERLVVALRYLDGLPVSEIARLTCRPVGTVTKQLSRAIDRLRSVFREVNQ